MPNISTLVDNFHTLDMGLWADSYGDYSVEGGSANVRCQLAYAAMLTPNVWAFPDGDTLYVRVFPAVVGSGSPTECTTAVRINHGSTPGTDIGIMYDAVANLLYFESRVDYWDASRTSVAFDSTNHAWWCLNRNSTTNFRFRTAPSSGSGPGTFTNRRTMTVPSWVNTRTDHRVILETHRNDANVGTAFFDGVNGATSSPTYVNNAKGFGAFF